MMGKSVVFLIEGRRRAGRSARVLGRGERCVVRRRRRRVLEMLEVLAVKFNAVWNRLKPCKVESKVGWYEVVRWNGGRNALEAV